jgi:hypothetical protein
MSIQREGFIHKQIGIEFKAETHQVPDVEHGAENLVLDEVDFLKF